MEEIKQAVVKVENSYSDIYELLKPFGRLYGSAAYSMLKNASSVCDQATAIIKADLFTNLELSSLLSALTGFGRHLSEIEQSVYEDIGSEKFDRIQTLLNEEPSSYNRIYYYLGLGKDK